MHKKIIAALLALILTGVLTVMTGCSKGSRDIVASSQVQNSDKRIKIETTFFAIGEFAKAVGKDKVDVDVIIPAGTEPHDFEPKAMDIARICDADIFAYNGIGMESWVDKALESANNAKLIKVDTSSGATLIGNSQAEEANTHGSYDPHLWLSLKGAEKQAGNIRNALVKADSGNQEYYDNNYKEFCKRLDAMYAEYSKKFVSLKKKDFVTGHAAFAYFCRDFGLQQNSVENVFAEGEPSAKRLKELVDYCRNNHISTIFMEDMASPRISETLAREVGAKVVKIYTAEAAEDGLDYIGCMQRNLKVIYASLK